MKKIACVYSAQGLGPIFEKTFPEALGEEIRFNHILDSNIMMDIIAEKKITPILESRLTHLFEAAVETDTDLVLCTCSSIGDVADKVIAAHPDRNFMRIDYPMAKYAADNYDKVAVMATLFTTVQPSCDLVVRLGKEQGKDIEVTSAVCAKALDHMKAGDIEAAKAEAARVAKELVGQNGAKILLLAQASMASFTDAIKEACPGLEVLNSPETFCKGIKKYFAGER